VDIKCLETFIKLAQLGSFSQTAELLQISQPGVSKQIQRLESYLGVTLFYRDGSGAKLTPAGSQVYEAGLVIHDKWETLRYSCKEFSGKAKEILRIGASTVPAAHFLPQWIAAYHRAQNGQAEFPGAELSITVGDSDSITEKLINEEIDIAFVGKPLEKLADFRSEIIGSDELVVIGPPKSEVSEISKEEIDWLKTPFILRKSGSGTRYATEQMLAARGISLNHINCVTTANDTKAIINLVKLSVGYAVVSSLEVKELAKAGELSIVTRLPERRYFYVVCSRRKVENGAVQAFLRAANGF
jgi:DNA-binding transcriptional LysR family regulator